MHDCVLLYGVFTNPNVRFSAAEQKKNAWDNVPRRGDFVVKAPSQRFLHRGKISLVTYSVSKIGFIATSVMLSDSLHRVEVFNSQMRMNAIPTNYTAYNASIYVKETPGSGCRNA